MIETKIRINIVPMEGEIWSFIPEGQEVCGRKFNPYRYYISNFGRVYDIQYAEYKEWSVDGCKYSVYLRDINNKRCSIILIDLLRYCFTEDQIRISDIDTNIYTQLTDDLIADIRNLYFGEKLSKADIMKRYNISNFSFQFAISDTIMKFKKALSRKQSDWKLSLQFMETLEEIDSNTEDPLPIKVLVVKACNNIGIEPSSIIYTRAYKYYKGNIEYVLIPKDVQRLSDKE